MPKCAQCIQTLKYWCFFSRATFQTIPESTPYSLKWIVNFEFSSCSALNVTENRLRLNDECDSQIKKMPFSNLVFWYIRSIQKKRNQPFPKKFQFKEIKLYVVYGWNAAAVALSVVVSVTTSAWFYTAAGFNWQFSSCKNTQTRKHTFANQVCEISNCWLRFDEYFFCVLP